VEALGPHVRQAAADQRLGWEGHGVPTRGRRVLIATADLASRHGEPAVVRERAAVDIPAQVRQDWRCAWHRRRAGDHPPCGPDRLGPRQSGAFLTHQSETPSATARREGLDRHQGGRTGGPPRGAVSGDSTRGAQAVDVRLVGQGTGPGVPHTQHPHQAAHIVRVRSKVDARWGRGPDQEIVEVRLRRTADLPALVGPGADQVHGGDRQACLPARCQPRLGVLTRACGATAMAASVVDVMCLSTGLARPQVTAQGLGPAVDQSVHGAAMAGQAPLAEACPRGGAIAPPDVGSLRQAWAPARSESSHERRDGGVHEVHGRCRQRRLAGGGPRALVAQPCVHDPQRYPPCPEVRGRGVPQGRDGGLCEHPTLAHHRGARLVAGSRGAGRRPVPGGEHPGAGPPALPVRPPPREDPGGPWHDALVPALALVYAYQPPLRVDVRDLPRRPCPQAPSAGSDRAPTPPGCRVFHHSPQVPDCRRTPHDRPRLALPGSHTVEDGPRPLPRALVEAPDPREMHPEGALRDLLLLEPAPDILAELRCAALVGSAPIVVSQLMNGCAITRLGLGGETSKVQVCAHARSAGSQRAPPVRVGHDLSTGVSSNSKIGSHSAAQTRGSEQGCRRTRLEDYRGAVSFNA
jgi:hypothetical protein